MAEYNKASIARTQWLILLRELPYSNKLKLLQPKNENFQIKKSEIFHISAQNKDFGHSLESPRQGGSYEYPQSMLSRNKKINVYPCKPKFYYVKVGFNGVKLIKACFRDVNSFLVPRKIIKQYLGMV